MAGKQTKNIKTNVIKTPAEQARRLWLASLGAFSLAQKRGIELFTRFIDEGKDLQVRTLTMVREVSADTQAQALGVFTPFTARLEKQVAQYGAAIENGMERVLARLGIPAKRDIDELSRQVAALSRKLKTAK
jgi:poly(hydroxyalkanoate) granule-associated protein